MRGGGGLGPPPLPPRGCSRGVKSGDDGMRMSPEGKRLSGLEVSHDESPGLESGIGIDEEQSYERQTHAVSVFN